MMSAFVSPRSVALLVLVVTIACGSRERPAESITLATTTSLGNSGLLDVLLPEFQRDMNVEVRPILVGSGRALAMMAASQADIVISHAPDAEAEALEQHPRWNYRKIMFNDFVIVGPPDDPARVAGAAGAEEAFRRIAQSGALFVSRGDSSGTHERERLLWRVAGSAPPSDRLVAAGQGMGTTLRISDQMHGYTLSDRATFAQNAAALANRILFEGGARLLNTYAVIFDSNRQSARVARSFAEWLATGRGREVVGAYRINGAPAFAPWPPGRSATNPADLPRDETRVR